MPFIEIERIWTDDDEMVQLDVRISNDVQVGKQDFYIYPEDLSEFGMNLQGFPKTSNDEVKLEYGEDPKYYCYFSLNALVLDGVGHSAIEVTFDNRLDPPSQAQVHFYIKCEPATINEFGRKLASWAGEMKEHFRYEWKNA
ncbi:hypothetical protein ACFL3A_01150 [Pseudomonadota bacterium]